MKGQQYIREVFKEALSSTRAEPHLLDGSFLMAALELLKEVDSPLREEAFAKLALHESGCCSQEPIRRRA
jgi:hypothetical protein